MRLLRIGLAKRDGFSEGQLVLGESAGLVRAEDIDAGQFLNGLQSGDDGLLL